MVEEGKERRKEGNQERRYGAPAVTLNGKSKR